MRGLHPDVTLGRPCVNTSQVLIYTTWSPARAVVGETRATPDHSNCAGVLVCQVCRYGGAPRSARVVKSVRSTTSRVAVRALWQIAVLLSMPLDSGAAPTKLEARDDH